MVKRLIVRKNRYFDSVFLMQVAHTIAGQPGIRDAFAVMGTDANRTVLAGLGYGAGSLASVLAAAAPNDLVFALEGEEAAVEAVASDPDRWLSRGPGGESAAGSAGARDPRSLAEALALRPDAGVAVISVPGEYAAREARAAIARGLSVFLFSSNVSVEDEVSLKRQARDKGLVVMGPDCGTAYLGGAGIGFANAVRRGPIGIVGTTGTGMQEFASLVHQAGSGISHGIGTGSRDLSDAIGGISTMAAIDGLERDPGTKVLTILSKPPGAETTARLLRRLAACAKPVVVCLLGAPAAPGDPMSGRGGRVRFASTIDEAVVGALEAVGVQPPGTLRWDLSSMHALAAAEVARMKPIAALPPRSVRGWHLLLPVAGHSQRGGAPPALKLPAPGHARAGRSPREQGAYHGRHGRRDLRGRAPPSHDRFHPAQGEGRPRGAGSRGGSSPPGFHPRRDLVTQPSRGPH
jgi:succinyl-CoA synthetase alpha subunit